MGAIYVECSSKESRGVDELFELAVTTAIKWQDVGAGEGGYAYSGNNSGGGGGSGGQQQAFAGMGRQKVRKRGCKIL